MEHASLFGFGTKGHRGRLRSVAETRYQRYLEIERFVLMA